MLVSGWLKYDDKKYILVKTKKKPRNPVRNVSFKTSELVENYPG